MGVYTIEKAKKVNADVVLATDPDADRVGIAVKDENGEFVLLNGNQTAALLTYYLLTRWNELGKLSGKEYIVKTIVTTELLFDMANKYNVEKFDVLTGFKFIADKILNNPEMTFIGGGEESYGFLIGDFVRDKDANSACFMIAEIAAWAAEQNKTLYQILKEIYKEFGFYKEGLLSLTKKGISGSEEIKISSYLKQTYLRLNMLWSILCVTAAYAILVALRIPTSSSTCCISFLSLNS